MCNNKELFLVGVLSLLEKSVSANIQESFLIRSARLSHACGRNYLPAANMPRPRQTNCSLFHAHGKNTDVTDIRTVCV